MKPENLVRADFITGIVLIVFSLTVLEESWRMPRLEQLGAHPMSAPGLVPGVLAAVLLILGSVLTLRSVKRGGHHLGLNGESIGRAFREPGNLRCLITLVMCIVYAGFLIGSIPYWLGTGIFVFLFVTIFEWRPGLETSARIKALAIAVIMGVVVSAAVTWIFQEVFLVTLP